MDFANKLEYDFHTKCLKELEKLIEVDEKILFIDKSTNSIADYRLFKYGRFKGSMILITKGTYCPIVEILTLEFNGVTCTYPTIKEVNERLNEEFTKKQDLIVSNSEGRKEKLEEILSELPL